MLRTNTHTCYIVCLHTAVFTSLLPSRVTEVHTRGFKMYIILLSWLNPNYTGVLWSYCRILSSSTNISANVNFAWYLHLCSSIQNQLCTVEQMMQAEVLILTEQTEFCQRICSLYVTVYVTSWESWQIWQNTSLYNVNQALYGEVTECISE